MHITVVLHGERERESERERERYYTYANTQTIPIFYQDTDEALWEAAEHNVLLHLDKLFREKAVGMKVMPSYS